MVQQILLDNLHKSHHIPIFQSGFGDGTYPVYWGIDEGGEICQLVIQFIDIELAYGNDEEN